jgi:RimJ/RimL family protein N-acetyltransferase
MEDCEAVLDYQSIPEVVRYVPWPVRDAALVEAAVAKAVHQIALTNQGDYLSLALVRKSDGLLIGQMNAMYLSESDQCGEIGYVVSPKFTGQGFATEASRALVSALFATQRFRRVIATLDDRNVASRIVVEKLGFRQEAHFIASELFKGEWISTLVYAILNDDWVRVNGRSTKV